MGNRRSSYCCSFSNWCGSLHIRNEQDGNNTHETEPKLWRKKPKFRPFSVQNGNLPMKNVSTALRRRKKTNAGRKKKYMGKRQSFGACCMCSSFRFICSIKYSTVIHTKRRATFLHILQSIRYTNDQTTVCILLRSICNFSLAFVQSIYKRRSCVLCCTVRVRASACSSKMYTSCTHAQYS